jgi:hypothetical protein
MNRVAHNHELTSPGRLLVLAFLFFLQGATGLVAAQAPEHSTRPRWVTRVEPAPEQSPPPDRDLEIAARFAPIIYQGLDGNPRFDYITNFDFDGDWRGDNNWQNADNSAYPLRAYVYYSVVETETHYFIHYATFHPRDYKGGLFRSWLLTEALHQAHERLKENLPSEAEDLALSHENDMEGCLIVAEKRGQSLDQAAVVYVETMAHNTFNQYHPPNDRTTGYPVTMEGAHPVLFSEPKGHGLLAYTDLANQLKDVTRGLLIYSYTGQPEDPDRAADKKVGYKLLPIYGTLWLRARPSASETYGESVDCGSFTVRVLESGKVVAKQVAVGTIGAAFLGVVGAANKARPPWGWFDYRDRQRLPGEWFFDPATTIKRHFYAYNISTVYVHHPYLDIWRQPNQ